MSIRLRLVQRPNLMARTQTSLPAIITGGDGISADRTGNSVTISLNIEELAELLLTDVPEADRDQVFFVIWDAAGDNFRKVDLDGLITILSSALDPNLAAIVALSPSINKGIYFTSETTAALFDLTSTGRSLLALDSVDAIVGFLGLKETSAGDDERTIPDSAFDFAPIRIFSCPGPLQANTNWDAEAYFDELYQAALGARNTQYRPVVGDQFVSWSLGNDANTGTAASAPKKTVAAALDVIDGAGSNTVWILPGDSFEEITHSYTANHTGGGDARPAKVKALEGLGSVYFYAIDKQPWQLTWTLDTGTIYTATPENQSGGSPTNGGVLEAVLYRYLDTQSGIYRYIPLTWFVDQAALSASGGRFGWAQDQGSLEVSLSYRGLNIEDNKSSFVFVYNAGAPGALSSVSLYFQDIIWVGTRGFVIDYEDAVKPKPVVFANNCRTYFCAANAWRNSGGDTYFTDTWSVQSIENDGFSYGGSAVVGLETEFARSLEYNCKSWGNGQAMTAIISPESASYPTTTNIQGSSMHAGGVIVRINPDYYNNYGQTIADVSETATPTKGWMVGGKLGNPFTSWATGGSPSGSADNLGGLDDGLFVSGQYWIDTTAVGGRLTGYGLVIDAVNDTNTVIKTFRSHFSGVTGDISGGSVVSYSPQSP